MAPRPPVPSSAPSLPSTTDFNALCNRISLAAAKQNTFLQSMRTKYPSLQTQKPSSPAPPTSPPPESTAPQKPGFSSLQTAAAAPAPAARRNPFAKSKAQLRAEQEDAADSLRFEPPNAGLGYIPSKAEAHADAATQELSRKLLGRRAKELKGRAQPAGAAKRALADEESDEDEGRSGLGRRKRARVVPVEQPAADEQETEADAGGSEAHGEDVGNVGLDEVHTLPAPVFEPSTIQQTGGKKKKRKSKKSKTSKSNELKPVT